MIFSLPMIGPFLTEAAAALRAAERREDADRWNAMGPGKDAGYTPGGDEPGFMSYGQRISWAQYLVMLLMAAAFCGLCRLFGWSPFDPGP